MDFGHIGSRDFVALRSLALINIETIKRTAPCYMSYSLPFLHFTIGRPIYKVYHKKVSNKNTRCYLDLRLRLCR